MNIQPRHMTHYELVDEGLRNPDVNPLAFHLALLVEGCDEQIREYEEEIQKLEDD